MGFSLVVRSRGCSLVALCGLLIAVACCGAEVPGCSDFIVLVPSSRAQPL